MTRLVPLRVDPALDLFIERIVDLPPKAIWDAWTKPAQLVKWFTPKPWTTVSCKIDLRPGGGFSSVMRSPEGVEYPNEGSYLEVVPHRRLVWTNAVAPGFRPAAPIDAAAAGAFRMTAVLTLTAHGKGTTYHALVRHATVEDVKKHEAMQFHAGWNAALDQLVAMVKARRAKKVSARKPVRPKGATRAKAKKRPRSPR